ncbi:autotransporter outer membrane beta-barrel domain-containing protein [Sphingobium sp. CR28]|uniref:autotransporter outer membrane beta-barrel domain-containing protein n=1 Tax=Sphingobium sp. CR28 TaxID=3400272 RepID=UPI003FF0EC82
MSSLFADERDKVRQRAVLLSSTTIMALICSALDVAPVSAQSVTSTGAVTPAPVQTPIWATGAPIVVGDGTDGTLTITDGGQISGTSGTIGSNAIGDVTVAGSDGGGNSSTWSNTGDLLIGDTGTGTLTIQNGGVVTVDGTSFVAYDAGSAGTVIVSGQDAGGHAASWTSGGDLVIGQFGTGALTISDGGAVTNATGYVGASGGSAGTVVVSGRAGDGTASTWTNSGDLRVGEESSGALTVQDGGAVTVGGDLAVGGFGGTGTVAVTNAGQLSSGSGMIGSNTGGDGQVLVAGSGSNWDTTGRITVGGYATGSLRLADRGQVSSDDGVVGSGAQGDVVVTGAGTAWVNAQQFTVGSFGAGTLRIEDGGSIISNQGYIGANSTGSVIVTGAGSNWLVTDFSLTVGNDGDGTLTIEDGGRVRAGGGLSLGVSAISSGNVILQGTAGSRATLETSQIEAGLGAISFSVDGGLLRATRDESNFFVDFDGYDVTLGANGGVIDTAGHDIGISPRIVGAGDLIKDGTGTLTLTGSNTYTGGTTIAAGTLRVSSNANLGAAAGGVSFDGGTLNTTADMTSGRDVVFAGTGTLVTDVGTTFSHSGAISGAGSFIKAGSGTAVLTGNSGGYTGAAQIEAGTLAVNGIMGGSLGVAATGRLEGLGRVGTVSNSGVVAPGFAGAMGTLTIAGDYAGNGGRLEIATALGEDDSPTSRLVVNGSTSGTTQVEVINRGGLGGQTTEGIKIIDILGASNGRFTLNGNYVYQGDQAMIAGAYVYRLYQGGVSTPSDGDWYLRSVLLNPTPNDPSPSDPLPLYQPGVPVYEIYAANLQALNTLPTLQQRVGNRSWTAGANEGSGVWGRIEGARNRVDAQSSTSLSDQTVNSWKMQLGADRALISTPEGKRLMAGVNIYYGRATSQVRSTFGDGSIATDGYGVGATLTWYGVDGFYVDGEVQMSWFDSDLTSRILGPLAKNNGEGQALGIELGKRSPIGGELSVTPQLQMIYSNVDFDGFTDPTGAFVRADRGDSLKSRLGLSLDRQNVWDGGRSHVYGLLNLNYDWLEGSRTLVSGTPIDRTEKRLWSELGIGASVNWGDRITLYGEASGGSPFRDFASSYVLKGNVGVRLRF